MRAHSTDGPAPLEWAPAPFPFERLAALRAEGPAHRVHVPGSGDAWLVVTREAVRTALTDPRLRNDIRHSAGWESDGGHAVGRNMLQSDPPHHTRLRRLVAGHFTPGRTAALRPASRPWPVTCWTGCRRRAPPTWWARTRCRCRSP